MKSRWLPGIVGLLIFGSPGFSRTVEPPYEIATWRGFRTAAVSFTLDDGSPNHYAKAIPMFDEFGFHLTLFIVTGTTYGWSPDWSALRSAASRGHEVASHTVTHASLAGMSDSLQVRELRDSRDAVNAQIPDRLCVTIAYPFCDIGNKSLCAQYYIAARICSGSIVPANPSDFMSLSSIICGELGSVRTAKHFIARVNSAVQSRGWCVFLLHGIDDDGGWSPVPSDTLRKTLEHLDANRDDVWVETFGNVARYIQERNAVSVTETSADEDRITVRVTDTLPDSVFDEPVTLRRPLPDGWVSAAASQNGRPVETEIVETGGVRYVRFDAVPDRGEVVITKAAATGIEGRDALRMPGPSSMQNYPNPFNPSTTIEFTLREGSDVRLKLLNVSGQTVKELACGWFEAGAHRVLLEASDLAGGVYFYKLEAGNTMEVKKLLIAR